MPLVSLSRVATRVLRRVSACAAARRRAVRAGGARGRAVRHQGHPCRGPAAHRRGHGVRVRCRFASATPTPTRRAPPRCARCSRPACSRTCASRSTARSWSSSSRSAPIIASVDFVGLKEFEQGRAAQVAEGLRHRRGPALRQALVDRAEQEIKRQYLTRSLYGAEVVTTVTPHRAQPRQRHLHDDRGRCRASIREIRIVGNKAFTESTLLGLFELSAERLAHLVHQERPLLARQAQRRPGDAARLLPEPRLPRVRDRVDAGDDLAGQAGHHDHHQRSSEGQPYTVTGVRAGRRLPRQGRRVPVRWSAIEPGRALPRRGRGRDDHARFVDRFGTFGYAFARVEPRPEIDRATGQVAVALRGRSAAARLRAAHQRGRQHAHARRGDPARVPPVRVVLVRRRARSSCRATGSTASATSSEVDVDTDEVPGTPDQVDLTITVEEKPTGNLSLGAGYSSAEKLSLTASIKQENVFGSGNYLGLRGQHQQVATARWCVSTVDPYFTVDGISRALRPLLPHHRARSTA